MSDATDLAGRAQQCWSTIRIGENRFPYRRLASTFNRNANNPKSDFLNWSIINAGTFDFASDAWSTSYGAAAEWYQGIFAFRAGVFDMSQTPAGGGNSAPGYELDSAFSHKSSSERSKSGTCCGDSPASSKSPASSFMGAWEILPTRLRYPSPDSHSPATPTMRSPQCAPIACARA
jgi:hypothetical protein